MSKNLIINFTLTCINFLNIVASGEPTKKMPAAWIDKPRKSFVQVRAEKGMFSTIKIDHSVPPTKYESVGRSEPIDPSPVFWLEKFNRAVCFECASLSSSTQRCPLCQSLWYCLTCKPNHLKAYHPHYLASTKE